MLPVRFVYVPGLHGRMPWSVPAQKYPGRHGSSTSADDAPPLPPPLLVDAPTWPEGISVQLVLPTAYFPVSQPRHAVIFAALAMDFGSQSMHSGMPRSLPYCPGTQGRQIACPVSF